MKHALLTLVAAFMLPCLAYPQFPNQQNIDSLLLVLKESEPDTNKVKTLNSLGGEFINVGMFDSARTYLAEAITLLDNLNFEKFRHQVLNAYGVSHFYQGRTHEALKYWEQAMTLAEQNGTELQVMTLQMNLANANVEFGNYPAALDGYYKVLAYYESAQNQTRISTIYSNIGVVYGAMMDHENALIYYFKALAIDSVMGQPDRHIISLYNIGETYTNLKNFALADRYLSKGLALAEEINHPPLLAQGYAMKANWHMAQFQLTEAVAMINQSNMFSAQIGAYDILATNKGRLCTIYYDMTRAEYKDALNKQFGGDPAKALQAAEAQCDSALAFLKEFGNVNGQKSAYENLTKVYRSQGDYERSLIAYEKFKVLNDSLLSIERDKKVTQMALQYEFDKKEAAARAEQEKKDIRQATIRNSVSGGLAGALIFLVIVYRQRNRIGKEKKRSDELLLNILPAEVAEELKEKGAADAKHFDQATVLFTDFKNFTELSERMSPAQLVNELNTCFKAFDELMVKYRIEKIKTIGDAYMAAGGLPDPQHGGPVDVVNAALDMQAFMRTHKLEREVLGLPYFEMRVGIHTGPLVAGIVGVKKFQYDIWGDTVNMAARMESSGDVQKVNISDTTYEIIRETPGLTFTHRGMVQAKGKGEVPMWFVERKQA